MTEGKISLEFEFLDHKPGDPPPTRGPAVLREFRDGVLVSEGPVEVDCMLRAWKPASAPPLASPSRPDGLLKRLVRFLRRG